MQSSKPGECRLPTSVPSRWLTLLTTPLLMKFESMNLHNILKNKEGPNFILKTKTQSRGGK